MPIKRENHHLYPSNWKTISAVKRISSGNKCEICDAMNGKPHPRTGSKVVLTVHHLDFNPGNNKDWNLIVVCQRCHNRLDAKWRAAKRRAYNQGQITIVPALVLGRDGYPAKVVTNEEGKKRRTYALK